MVFHFALYQYSGPSAKEFALDKENCLHRLNGCFSFDTRLSLLLLTRWLAHVILPVYWFTPQITFYIIFVYINIQTQRHNWIRMAVFIQMFHSTADAEGQSPKEFYANKHCINFPGHITLAAVWQSRLVLNALDTWHMARFPFSRVIKSRFYSKPEYIWLECQKAFHSNRRWWHRRG